MTSNPGLDVDQLRALRTLPHDLTLIRDRIADHLATHDGYVALSGGKDSLVVLHLALQVDPNVPVCFFDSGLEYPETYTFLADLADTWSLQLQLIPARINALQLLVDDGSWDHRAPDHPGGPSMGTVHITEPARLAHQRHGAGELWGVRSEEARGRAIAHARALAAETTRSCAGTCHNQRATHGGVIRRVDGTVAYGPIWNWKTHEVWSYLARHQIPSNPVYAKLQALGAPEHFQRISNVLDANRLEEGRAAWLKRGWPDLFERLRSVLPRLGEYV